jgi:hypothetical protein
MGFRTQPRVFSTKEGVRRGHGQVKECRRLGGVEASLGPFANYLPVEVMSVQNCTGPDYAVHVNVKYYFTFPSTPHIRSLADPKGLSVDYLWTIL